MIEHYVLSEQDLSLIRQRSGDHNRLRIAVELALLRFPGIELQPDETPPEVCTAVKTRAPFCMANCMRTTHDIAQPHETL